MRPQAFNLLGLLHTNIVRLAQHAPVRANLNGGLDRLEHLNETLQRIRVTLTDTAASKQALLK